MSDMHSFSVDVAKEVGVNAAILLQSIKWWCEKNKANGKHFHEGLHWTYNSIKAWQELYPYLGKSAIDSALRRLEERGYVKTGNYNKSAYDRTKWYAITYAGLRLFGESIFGNQEMGEAETGNPKEEDGEPIPDTSQLPITDAKPDTGKKPSALEVVIAERTSNPELVSAIGGFIVMRKRIKKPLTAYALKIRLNKLWKLGNTDEERIAIVEQSVGACWQDFYELKSDVNARKPQRQLDLSAYATKERPGSMRIEDGITYVMQQDGSWQAQEDGGEDNWYDGI